MKKSKMESSRKSKKGKKKGRKGYPTVARTRGVYGEGEMKYFDTERAAITVPSSATWTSTVLDPNTTQEAVPVANPGIFTPIQGSAINQRIGRKAKVFKIKVRGMLFALSQTAQTVGDNPSEVRLLFVQDNQTNSAAMTGAQLMSTPTTATTDQVIHVFQSTANFGRFRVLKDKLFSVQNPNMAGEIAAANVIANGLARPFKMNFRFKKGIEVTFNATNGGTIADIVNTSWHIVANASANTMGLGLTYNARVCYKE